MNPQWKAWETMSAAEVASRAARLFPSAQPSPQQCDQEAAAHVVETVGDGTHIQTCALRAPTTLDRLTALFAAPRIISTGDVCLDQCLLDACGGQNPFGGVTPPSSSSAQGSSCGGLEAGRLYEVYGPSLCGKTQFVQTLISTHARHMVSVYGPSAPQPPPSRDDGSCGGVFVDLHPGSWDVIVALTTPVSQQQQQQQQPSTAAVTRCSAGLSDWATSFFSKLHRGGGGGRCDDESDTFSGVASDAVLREACARHVHLVPISEPNALLECVDQLHDALVRSSSSSSSSACNVLFVVDSLEPIWSHASLQSASAATHASHWYAAELHRRLRRCLALDLCAAVAPPSSRHAPLHHIICLTVNGCGYYDLQRLRGTQTSATDRHLLLDSLRGSAPRVLGGSHWQQVVDCRLLLEPADAHVMGLVTSSSSSFENNTRASHASAAAKAARATGPSSLSHRKRQRHGPDGDADEAKMRMKACVAAVALPVRFTVIGGAATTTATGATCAVWQK